MDKVTELEQAILKRAQQLAHEYQRRAERSRLNILREASERLQLREQREVLVAKASADRTYRRMVQANTLKLHAQLDHSRWNLIRSVMARMPEQIEELVSDRARYLPVLIALIAVGAREMGQVDIIAALNQYDHERFAADWESIAAQTSAGARMSLADKTIECSGGVLLHTADNRIRLDNTFEGRQRRLQHKLYRIIQERLLPEGLNNLNMIRTGT